MSQPKSGSPIKQWFLNATSPWTSAKQYWLDRQLILQNPQLTLHSQPSKIHSAPVGFALQGMVLAPTIIVLIESFIAYFLDLPPTLLEKMREGLPLPARYELIDSPQVDRLNSWLRPIFNGLSIVLASIIFRISFTWKMKTSSPSTKLADKVWLYYVTARLFPPTMVFAVLIFCGEMVGRYQSLFPPFNQALLAISYGLAFILVMTLLWWLWIVWNSSSTLSWVLGFAEKPEKCVVQGNWSIFARMLLALLLGRVLALLIVAPVNFVYVLLRW
jgi:hypothetical protein